VPRRAGAARSSGRAGRPVAGGGGRGGPRRRGLRRARRGPPAVLVRQLARQSGRGRRPFRAARRAPVAVGQPGGQAASLAHGPRSAHRFLLAGGGGVAVAGTLANESPTPGTATAWSGGREAARTRLRALAWPVVLALTGLAAAAPLWSSALLPFQDGPQHLASVRVIADYHAPGLGFDRWFVLDLRRLEYLGFYLPAAALAKWIGTDAATRVLLSLIALALPAATWMLLGAFGRDRRLAGFAPALFHTTPLYRGFFTFVASVPALIAAVAL